MRLPKLDMPSGVYFMTMFCEGVVNLTHPASQFPVFFFARETNGSGMLTFTSTTEQRAIPYGNQVCFDVPFRGVFVNCFFVELTFVSRLL